MVRVDTHSNIHNVENQNISRAFPMAGLSCRLPGDNRNERGSVEVPHMRADLLLPSPSRGSFSKSLSVPRRPRLCALPPSKQEERRNW